MRTRNDEPDHPPRRWTRALMAAAAGAVLALGACNTMEGVGQDMQAAGQGLENEAEDANN